MNIAFEAKGLRPGEWIEATFAGPQGLEARWITDEDATAPWSTQHLRADETGVVRWIRYGAQDEPGTWSMTIGSRGSVSIVRYTVEPFRLRSRASTNIGVRLIGCRSEQAEILFSESVHFALTVGMHRQLQRASDLLDQRLGVRSRQLPVIHLVGSKDELDTVQVATGGDPGWEDGFFRSWGGNPGIYVHTDASLTDTFNMLTHEYVHFLMYEVTNGKQLPAWLSEGLAEYYEFEVGLLGERPQATVWRKLRSADRAQEAAESGSLFPLKGLESRRTWNSRVDGDQVSLQYSQSHMLVRYVSDTYGESAALEMARSIGEDAAVESAVRAATGVSYAQLEQDFVSWLVAWDDPERAAARPYIQLLDELLAERLDIRAKREEVVEAWNVQFNRTAAKNDTAPLAAQAADLVLQLEAARAPASLADLHQAALTFLGFYSDFISEDLKFFTTGQRASQRRNDELRSGLRTWGNSMWNLLADAKFVLNLNE